MIGRHGDSTLAKVTPPSAREVVPRKRLFRQLDLIPEGVVTWIQGPPGSGKTTLVASYLEKAGSRVLWYRVDLRDDDPATFFYYLGLAIKKVRPRSRKTLPLFTLDLQRGLTEFTSRFLDELFGVLPRPSALVLDDYHEVPEESPVQQIVRSACQSIPEGIRIIITSRAAPPPPLARLVMNGIIATLNGEELRLTPEEVQSVVRSRLGGRAKEASESLFRRTQGWAAGLVLLLGQPSGTTILTEAMADSDPQVLSDYFASEILERTDTRTQNLLLKTSLLPRLSAEMATELAGDQNARSILEDLSGWSYFTERLGNDDPIYQYHPLFRRFLLAQLGKSVTRGTLQNLREQAATLLERAEQFDDAVTLLQEDKNWKHIADLITQRAPVMLAHGRNQTLEDWFAALPAKYFVNRPWLSYWLGACRMLSNPVRARYDFAAAFDAFRRLNDRNGQFLALSSITDTIILEWSRFHTLDRWANEFERLYAESPSFSELGVEAHAAVRFLNCLIFRQPQHPQIQLWAERVENLIRRVTEPSLRVLMASALSHYYHCTGDFKKARVLLDLLRPTAESMETSPLILLAWYVINAGIARNTNDFSGSLAAVRKGLAQAQSMGAHFMDLRLLAQGTYTTLAQEDSNATREFLEEMRARLDEGSLVDLVHYNFVAACDADLRGEYRLAKEYALAAVRDAEETGSAFTEALATVALAHVLFGCGEVEKAESRLASGLRLSETIGSRSIVFAALCAKAYFSLQHAGPERAVRALRRAMTLGQEEGYLGSLWWRNSMMSTLCACALENGIEPEYTHRLIRERDLAPPSTALDLNDWPWRVCIRTLGAFAVTVDGKPASFSTKAQRRPLELLKALLSFGGREVSGDVIMDALWPDAEGDAAHRSFDTTLHRLRKWLGDDRFLLYRDARLSLNPTYCWVDAWTAERRLDQLDAVLQSRGSEADWNSALTPVLELYRDHFLASDSSEWAVARRERLRSKLLRILRAIGRTLEAADRWDDAIECYQRGLEVSPESEALYLRLMLAYEHLGRRSEAIAVYRRCSATLEATLGALPSDEMEAAHDRLQRVTDPADP